VMPEYILYTVSEEMHSGELEYHDYELDNASMPGILSHLKAGRNVRICPSWYRDYTLSAELRERWRRPYEDLRDLNNHPRQ